MIQERSSEPAPLVLTLKLDAIAFQHFNALRQQHFPPQRNFLPAHVTLFHALPGAAIATLQATLQTRCAQTPLLALQFAHLRFLGKGVAVEILCPELQHLHRQLATQWHDWLTPQDRQPLRPHLTLQNKVSPEQARSLYQQLLQTWQPLSGQGEGLLLWHYRGGPWELAQEFTFTAAEAAAEAADPPGKPE